jgi:predicted DNA-binding transcriptional regulator AlpA
VNAKPTARENLLTVEEVAEWLQVSPAWVYDRVPAPTTGKARRGPPLPCVRLGICVRFRSADVEDYIAECVRIANRKSA